MSENTTPETPAPDNITPLPTQEANQAAQDDQTQQEINSMIANVDLEKVTKDDVFTDIIQASKLFAFRLMVGAALLERLIVKGQEAAAQSSTECDPGF